MTQTIRVETFLDVPVEKISGPSSVIHTYDEYVCLGWIDEHDKSHGGHITLTQAALLLFPDEEENP